MYYRMMGNTGIQVSVLSYGFWATYGVKDRLTGDAGVKSAKELMRIAREAGVNCFDHAEAYGNPNGEAERIFGMALKELQSEDDELWRRSELVITTKIFWGGPGVNESGLSIKHCREGMDKCGKIAVGLCRHGILSQAGSIHTNCNGRQGHDRHCPFR